MASTYRIMLVGIIGFLVFGAGMAYFGYQSSIYPVDRAMGYLSRAESSQTPEQISEYVNQAKKYLPQGGNPVWSFPTARTDFGLIQNELDNVLLRANAISSLEPHSAEYSTGLADIHFTLRAMQVNLLEALPYLYVSFTNVVLSTVWIAIIMLIFAVMRRGRARYREQDAT